MREEIKAFMTEDEGVGVVEIILILCDNYVPFTNYLYCLLC